MNFLIWFLILGLIVFSYISHDIPLWVPLVVYLAMLSVKVIRIIGDYRDWLRISKRDENLKIEETAEDMAGRGLAFSGMRNREENKVREDFEHERRRKRRQFWVDLFNALLLLK